MKTRRITLALATLIALSVGTYRVGKAWAYGIPTSNPLVYTGTLTNNGVPLTGSHFIELKVLGSPDGGAPTQVCFPVTQSVTVTNGTFSVPLDPTCLTQVHLNPNLSVDVSVDNTDLGAVPISAVPYAVESNTASNYAPGSQIAQLVPPGTIIAYGGTVSSSISPPPGWLYCDGSAVAISSYSSLFNAIGNAWGAPDQQHFNLPDLRGRFPRGSDDGSGNDPDASTRGPSNPNGNATGVGSLESSQFASHNHALTDPGHAHGVNDPGHSHTSPGSNWVVVTNPNAGTVALSDVGSAFPGTTNAAATGISIQASGTGITLAPAGGSETRPVNLAVSYLIKY